MEPKYNPTKEELQKLYQFHSCTQIGKMNGVCAEVVRRLLHKHQIQINKRGGRRSFDPPKAELESLYQAMSMKAISEHYGVGETVVFMRLKEHGIELKEHKNHRLKPGRIFSEEHKRNISLSGKRRAVYGPDNPNWKGGLTEKNRIARTNWEAREWKKSSLLRAESKCEKCGVEDGQTCNCCGVRVKLHVHHIKSFAKFPADRYDPMNSKVLCPKCHHEEHDWKIRFDVKPE